VGTPNLAAPGLDVLSSNAVTIAVDRIREAAEVIDPAFKNTPQFLAETLSEQLGLSLVLKVECINPIRSFKGRGTDYLLHRIGAQPAGFVCASAGNFGQGMAYAARKRSQHLTVFAAVSANPLKVSRMRSLGAEIVLAGADFDSAKAAAKQHAHQTRSLYMEDGLAPEIAEGAGTIALELGRLEKPHDAMFIPLGNGSLINGIGTWVKQFNPATRVIGVCAAGAPAMELSWRAGKPISTEMVATIADGIAVRVPIPQALVAMRATVDEVMLVTDEEIVSAMQMLFIETGMVVEPAGAAGLAGLAKRRDEYAGRRVAVPICGGNLTEDQVRRWLLPPP
jgi:threonine dehydratase